MTEEYREVSAPDGRALEVLTGGDPDGFPLLFHGGSPSAAVGYEPFDRAVREAGLRSITYSRPGYGGSTAHPRPEPRMVDDVADSVVVLDALGVDRFVTAGWSGGGPRALGCAALLSDRCLAAASIAGVGPHDGEGLDWKGGMAEENVAEYTAAEAGREAYAAFLEEEFLPILLADADDLAEGMGGLLPPADKAAMDRGFTEWLDRVVPPRRRPADRRRARRRTGRGAAVGLRRRRDHACRCSSTRGARTRWCRSRTASGWPRTCPAPRRT